jgi:putative tricarboxylic transport membrane protein
MTRVYQTVAVIIISFGAFVIYLSLDLSYSADFGPGPGFFSFWLGILLIVLGLLDLIGTSRKAREALPAGFIPDRTGVKRILFVGGSLVASIFLMPRLGFTLTILLFSIFLLRTMGRQPWWATLAISGIGSFGTFRLFKLLQVSLPTGPWGF